MAPATNCYDDLPDCVEYQLGLLHLDYVATVRVADALGVKNLGEAALGGSPRRPCLRPSGAKVESLVRTACGAVGR